MSRVRIEGQLPILEVEERELVSAVLLDGEQYWPAVRFLHADEFGNTRYAEIWRVFLKHGPLDDTGLIRVLRETDQLDRIGVGFIVRRDSGSSEPVKDRSSGQISGAAPEEHSHSGGGD